MAEELTTQEVVEAMFKYVEESTGKKKVKPGDVSKMALEKFKDRGCTKQTCKDAIRELVESGRVVYTYFGGTFLELPHKEASANE